MTLCWETVEPLRGKIFLAGGRAQRAGLEGYTRPLVPIALSLFPGPPGSHWLPWHAGLPWWVGTLESMNSNNNDNPLFFNLLPSGAMITGIQERVTWGFQIASLVSPRFRFRICKTVLAAASRHSRRGIHEAQNTICR